MGDQLAKAEEFEKKAEKKLSGWGLFGSKYEDAADLFDKAANSFKLAKSCNFSFLILSLLLPFAFRFETFSIGFGVFSVVIVAIENYRGKRKKQFLVMFIDYCEEFDGFGLVSHCIDSISRQSSYRV